MINLLNKEGDYRIKIIESRSKHEKSFSHPFVSLQMRIERAPSSKFKKRWIWVDRANINRVIIIISQVQFREFIKNSHRSN